MTETKKVIWPTPGNTITTSSGMIYTIGQPINSGGYALVFEGADLFGNSVVLKVFKPANRKFEEVHLQWAQETKLFIKLRHSNVVTIYDAFICDNLFYIVLERAWGNLCDWIRIVGGKANEVTVREIARQLLFAIYFIHKEKVLHRDITIYNTLVFEGTKSRGAIFKISDFGISKEFTDPWSPQIARTQIAHPCFIPPELLLSQYGYSNEQSDLYHLGLVLLYSLTGDLPLKETMNPEQINKMIIDGAPRIEAEKTGTPLGNFISVLLRRHNEYRFKTALEAWNALRLI
ncbi:MAG: protein kinase [Planctomycetes bacterium]|nr:protein kinase [Planctomycetota bacterium]